MKKAKLLTGIALALTMGSLVACGGKETKAAGTSKVGQARLSRRAAAWTERRARISIRS